MIYLTKNQTAKTKKIVADDMILTTDMPTTAGSKMLDGYASLFEAQVVSNLKEKDYALVGKTNVGEFGIDLLGETSFFGGEYVDDKLQYPSVLAVKNGDADAAIVMDINGAPRRGASQNNLVLVKPTYGTVSRFGTIPVACSGEVVSVLAKTPATCKEVLSVVAGYDCKDGTSLPQDMVNQGKNALTRKNKVAVLSCMLDGIDGDVKAKIDEFVSKMQANNVEVVFVDDNTASFAGTAWNILMSAELCNNVSRYDGVKYGYRAKEYSNIDELYTNSRTEAFGDLLKCAILFGSETLSTDNYDKVYDKALRVRRVVKQNLLSLLADCDALVMPAVSKLAYDKNMVAKDKFLSYKENFYTAPSSITGLPAVVAGGVQLVGNAFAEEILLDLAELVAEEDRA